MRSLFIKAGIALTLYIGMSSCKKGIDEFLEVPPGVSLNEDKVFSARQQVELYVSTGYQFSIPTFFPVRDATFAASPSNVVPAQQATIFAGATDEAESSADFVPSQNWNNSDIQPINILSREDYYFYARYKGIRIANTLLERIDGVPDADDAYKNQVKAEAKFMRAINNFEMFKRYGGFQLVDKRITVEESVSLPRSSVEECVNAIVKDCDEAMAQIPAGFPTAAQKGRINKSAIAALKARTLLYAASPLFNTGTPYLSLGENNKLICYGNFSAERWQKAADAAQQAIDIADSEGFQLLDVEAKRNPAPVNRAVLGNYRDSWEVPDNNELILSYKGFPASNRFNHPWQHVLPNMTPFDGSWCGTAVNHRFIKKYTRKADGLPQNWQSSGNDLVQKYAELDPRFAQTVAFNGSRFSNNQPIIETFQGGIHAATCRTGAWMKKLVPDALYTGNQVPIISVFRYNELLLNLAEALNEALPGGANTAAYTAINRIRTRSGMPPIAGLSKDQFREKIQDERAIELAFENYRFWDVRRWMIAENDGVMRGNVLGLRITALPTAGQYRYEEFVVEGRTFNRNLYLHPYDRDEVLKNKNLIQNPGW